MYNLILECENARLNERLSLKKGISFRTFAAHPYPKFARVPLPPAAGTHETFEYLCDLVRVDQKKKQQTRKRAPISVEERVGLALWRLATGNSYRSCGLQFG